MALRSGVDGGGPQGDNQQIQNCILHEPLGWTAIVMWSGGPDAILPDGRSPCIGAFVGGNTIISAGRNAMIGDQAI